MKHLLSQKNGSAQSKYDSILRSKSFVFVFFISILSFGTRAQTTLNATGGTATNSGGTFSYSIGEMILVSTETAGNFYFTQGILQNDDANLEIHNSALVENGLEIYPNPVKHILYLQASFDTGGELSLKLYDLRGRLIIQNQIQLNSGIEKEQMDFSSLQEGTYLLQVALNQNGKAYQHSFKVVKYSRR